MFHDFNHEIKLSAIISLRHKSGFKKQNNSGILKHKI